MSREIEENLPDPKEREEILAARITKLMDSELLRTVDARVKAFEEARLKEREVTLEKQ